ncbi:hypothetical protein ACLMJK_007819 [Lecanora helva]
MQSPLGSPESPYTNISNDLMTKLDDALTPKNAKDPKKRFARKGVTKDVLSERKLTKLFSAVRPSNANTYSRPDPEAIARRVTGAANLASFSNVLAVLLHTRCSEESLRAFMERLMTRDDIPSDAALPLGKPAAREVFGDFEGTRFWQSQFPFCPVVLKFGSVYPAGCQLPFTKDAEYLGEGGYGKVWEVEVEAGHMCTISGMCNGEPQVYAQKVVLDKRDFDTEYSMAETLIQATKSHINILVPIASLRLGDELSLFFELAKCSLWAYFQDETISLDSIDKRTNCFFQTIGLAGALTFLHEELILSSNAETYHLYHHDLKPDNILVFKNGKSEIWKISDFGVSQTKRIQSLGQVFDPKMISSGVRNPCYGYTYAAPEAKLQGHMVTRRADVWSLGCIITLVLTFMDGGWTALESFTAARVEERNDDDRFYFDSRSLHKSRHTSIINPSVPRWLEKLVSTAMNRTLEEGHAIEEARKLLLNNILRPDQQERSEARQVEYELRRIHKLLTIRPIQQENQLKHEARLIRNKPSFQGPAAYPYPQSIPSASPLYYVDDRLYNLPRRTPGRRSFVRQEIASATDRWLEGIEKSTLLVQASDAYSWKQSTLDLAIYIKDEAIRNSFRVVSFCIPNMTEVSMVEFLISVNHQLATLNKRPSFEDQYDNSLAEIRDRFEFFCRQLEEFVAGSVIPVFGIFHNLTWLNEDNEGRTVTLGEIIDAIRRVQEKGPLKVLFTATAGISSAIQSFEQAVAPCDTFHTFAGGNCPLSELRLPVYQQ